MIQIPKGTRCGHLVVIQEVEHAKGESRQLLCRCDCGKEKVISLYSIAHQKSKSCGCNSWVEKKTDMSEYIGKKYGKLTILEEVKTGKYQHIKVKCRCDCGNEKIIVLESIINGVTQSCGCLRYTDHGVKRKSRERLYHIRLGMLQRCNNPNYPFYYNHGGRGIKVCKEWTDDYFAFRKWALENGYKDNLTIDRIDNDGDYEPSNCRWATIKEQSNNTRRNLNITYNGETHTASEWSEITGINRSTIYDRYSKGLDLDLVFSKEPLY